jgi:hypothetical protein
MAAAKYDFPIEQGTSFEFSLIYKDPDNEPINLSGWCARLTWRTSDNTSYEFLTTNTDYSKYKFEIDAVNGKLTLMLPASTTNGYTFSNAKYDLELQSPDDIYSGGGNEVSRVLYGIVTIVGRYSLGTSKIDC